MMDSDFENVDADDPFADRRHGPRTRRRAHKEEEKIQTEHQHRLKQTANPIDEEFPTHRSFAQLEPAAFPSLDTGLTVVQNQEILRDRALVRQAEQESDPFVADEDDYFTENPTQAETALLTLKALREQAQQVHRAGAVAISRSKVEPTPQEIVLQNTVQSYNHETVRYETFLTRNSATGKIVRWHKRVADSRAIPCLDGSFDIEDPTHALPELDSDSGSDSDSDSYQPATPSKSRSYNHPLLAEYVRRKHRVDMAENVPPTASNNDDSSTRGMPYYDRLKKTLKTSIKQKQELEDQLTKIEQSIWNKEAAYLDDTVAGNIMKGFDNYIKASGAPGGAFMGGGTASRKKATVSEQDRLFSRSSVGFWNSMREGSPHASATSTPSHAPTPKGLSDHPTPTSTTSTKAPGLKKKKNADKDDESDSKAPNKRLKITFSRNDKD